MAISKTFKARLWRVLAAEQVDRAAAAEAAAAAEDFGLEAFARPGDEQLVAHLQKDHRQWVLTNAGICIVGAPLSYFAYLFVGADPLTAAIAAVATVSAYWTVFRLRGIIGPKPTLEGLWRERQEAKTSNAFYSALITRR